MFPLLVDMTEDESWKVLRFLELEAYSSLVTALRAQGSLDSNKLKFIKEAGSILHISEERFKSELKRVVLDERLNTVAYYASGSATTWEDWIQEGRSVIPPLPRAIPQTAYSAIADQVAEDASKSNELLPLPAYTERKRGSSFSQTTSNVLENNKNIQFRVPESVKNEDCKKRKVTYGLENNSLGQHLINAPKMSRIQQIYRQKTKAKLREQQQQIKSRQQEQEQKPNYQRPPHNLHPKYPPYKQHKLPLSPQPSTSASPKINILQNISLQSPRNEEMLDQIKSETENFTPQKSIELNNVMSQPGCSNENEAPKNINSIKTTQNYKHISSPTPTNDVTKTVKVCPIRKTSAKTASGQKLIIVSNPQTITTSSILQRTLSIPFVKNISVKNFEKFKIVSTSATPVTLNLTAVTSSVANVTSNSSTSKHKILSFKTNTVGKKIIPLSHLQALSAKGGIKMLPLGAKIITTKTPIVNSSTAPVYIMNSMGNAQTITKSSLNTPVMVTSKAQTVKYDSETIVNNKSTHSNENDENITSNSVLDEQESSKSLVLAEILKASGVSVESESFSEDIESQITQLTAIPQALPERITSSSSEVQGEESQEVKEENEVIQENYIIEEQEDIQENDYVQENHFIECHETQEKELIEKDGVQERHGHMKDNLVKDSVDSYIILDKTSNQNEILDHYDGNNTSVHVVEFGENKSNFSYGELELTVDNVQSSNYNK